MQRTLETVEYKCWFYETAREAGTVQAPKSMTEQEVPGALPDHPAELEEDNRKDARAPPAFSARGHYYVRSLKVLGARR